MSIFSKFENRMEDTVEGAASKMSRAPISPVQIAKKAEKQMKRGTMVGAGKEYAPTLYTILVNPDDDARMFGYYPTLAGETETYLEAKAAQEGFVMDGHPLVRFIVDDSLRHGKFDVIAEAVAAPIVAQLRDEEMERYGIQPRGYRERPQQAHPADNSYPQYGQGYAQPQPAHPQGGQAPMGYQPVEYAEPRGYDQPADYDRGSDYGRPPAYDDSISDFDRPAWNDGGDARPMDAFQDGYGDSNWDAGYGYEAYAQAPSPDFRDAPAPAPEQPKRKPPLPYVPEDEIDRSIDYGEYTFNSEDFEDYRDKAEADAAAPVAFHDETPQIQVPNTVAFAGGAGAAGAVPDHRAVRARLVDRSYQRPYDLAGSLITLGRDTSNDIVVQDINASRKHADLRVNPQGIWVITDLSSTNGTLVNGISVASQPLYPGDIVTIGKTEFEFLV